MIIKIINTIFLRITKNKLNSINLRSIKKTRADWISKRSLALIKTLKFKKRKKKRFVSVVKRRWRSIFYRRRPIRIYKRRYIKRKLRRFRFKTLKKVKLLNKLTKLFLFLFYFKIEHNLNFFFLLLYRFSIHKFKLMRRVRRRRYFSRGRYVFEKMLARTFINKKKKLIIAIGKKKHLPANYNPYPLKISVFTSIRKKSFYDREKLACNNNINYLLFLLKNFKKSNLFMKNNINNTDFFVKLNIKTRRYSLFNFTNRRKLTLQTKINITSRQITVLKQARLRIYNFYYKKSRNYKVTKFFLKLSSKTTLLNWLINWEFKLINIILRSKITRSYKQASSLINCGYIFVNGIIKTNKNYLVEQGDLIQIPVNTTWFLKNRLQTSFFNKFLNDLNKYTKKNHLLAVRYFFKSSKKERSWLLENLRNFSKTPTYMEVDYTTLSIIIIKKTVNSDEVLPIYTNTFKPLTARLYNWRYFY